MFSEPVAKHEPLCIQHVASRVKKFHAAFHFDMRIRTNWWPYYASSKGIQIRNLIIGAEFVLHLLPKLVDFFLPQSQKLIAAL
jgi:hypothetical protein